MNPELKEVWTDALLSGLYPQGTGYLNVNGEYCCLGVLCEVAIEQGYPIEREELDSPGDPLFQYRVKGDNSLVTSYELLEDNLLEMFDLDDDEQAKLANANDSGQTFAQIVDLIDELL